MSNRKRKQLVADQFGIIRPDDQPGNGYREVAKQARAGYLERLCRGHYVVAHAWEGLHREKRLAITALAVVSETSSGVISGAAALALHGSWVLVRDAKIVVVCGSQQFHGIDYCMRLRSEIHLDHTQGLADRRVAVLARAAFDECRVRFRQKGPESVSWRAAVLAVEGALRHGVTRDQLEELPAHYPSVRGQELFHRALAVCHGRCETPGEAMTKAALLELGLKFHEQAEIWTRGTSHAPPHFLARVDFYVPDLLLVVEFDGHIKYSASEVAPTPEAQSELLTRETYRERSLRATGLDVARVVWKEVEFHAVRLSTLRSILIERERVVAAGGVTFCADVRNAGPLIG